jgi:hypothetical protein
VRLAWPSPLRAVAQLMAGEPAREVQVELGPEAQQQAQLVLIVPLSPQHLSPSFRMLIFPRRLVPAPQSTENASSRFRRPRHQWNSSGFFSQ